MIQPTNVQQQPYPQQGANAVSINIYNPQAYGSGASTCAATQQAPYQYDSSFYNVPQTSAYTQSMPQTQTSNQMQAVYPQQYMPAQNPIIPAPQVMPQSVISTPEETPAQQETLSNDGDVNQESIPAEEQTEIQTPEEEQIAPEDLVNTDELVEGLKSQDVDTRADAINKIAAYTQDSPEKAMQVVSMPIMQALADIIKEDTSSLEGPTDKQIEIAEKISKNEKLTPEEEALAEELSPRDKENKNRIFALYTLAMIEKLQRDEYAQYVESKVQNGEEAPEPLKITDLIGYEDIKNVINNDSRPEVKVAAIQALQYIAEEQDKEEIEKVLEGSLNSDDPAVKTAAEEAVAQFASQEETAQQEEPEQEETKTEEQAAA